MSEEMEAAPDLRNENISLRTRVSFLEHCIEEARIEREEARDGHAMMHRLQCERIASLAADLEATHKAWAEADCCKHADRLIESGRSLAREVIKFRAFVPEVLKWQAEELLASESKEPSNE